MQLPFKKNLGLAFSLFCPSLKWVKLFLIITILIFQNVFNIRAQNKLPSTKVQVIKEQEMNLDKHLFRRVTESELKDTTLIKLLMSSQFDKFIAEGISMLEESVISEGQKLVILNTIISIHGLRYDYNKIQDLIEQQYIKTNDLLVNKSEIEFFRHYPTKTEFQESLPIQLPFKWSIAKTPMIDVVIDGQRFSFWLDIGASGSVVSSSVASKIKIFESKISNKESGGSTDNVFTIKPAIIPKIEIADISIENLPVAILNVDDLTLAPGITIDGIVGLPFLFEFETTLDNQNKMLTLDRASKNKKKKRNCYWLGYPIVQLHLLNGVKTYWGFDTGAGTSRIKRSMLDHLDSSYQIRSIQIKESGVGGLTNDFKSHMISRLPVYCNDNMILFENIKETTPEGVRTDLMDAAGKLGSDVIYNSKGVRFSFTNGFFEFIE